MVRFLIILFSFLFSFAGMQGPIDGMQGSFLGCGKPGFDSIFRCPTPIPIIPGLVGFGVDTPAGSGPNRVGGTIIHVTNLNASGAGSFKDAVESSGARVVVFDVSGYITPGATLSIDDPYLTIAGQTAPSPGITIRAGTLAITTHDVLIQHLRMRPGDDSGNPSFDSRDCVNVTDQAGENDVHDIVFDHVSCSWQVDGGIDINPLGGTTVRDVTIHKSIIAEGLNNAGHSSSPHSTGILLGVDAKNIAITNSLIASNLFRNPVMNTGSSMVFSNNAVDNYGQVAFDVDGQATEVGPPAILATIIGNLFIRGTDTQALAEPLRIRNTVATGSKVYFKDVCASEVTVPGVDDWDGADDRSTFDIVSTSPPIVFSEFTSKSCTTVKTDIIANAGAWPDSRDSVDTDIIADFNATGGAPTYSAGTASIKNDVAAAGGYPALTENTSAYVPPANPWAIQPSGYNKLEEDLQAKAAAVE